MYLKNKNNVDYTDQVRVFFNVINEKYKYSARVSDIWSLLMTGFGIKEFVLLDPKFYANGKLEADLIDYLISWKNEEDIDFSEIAKEILETGDFTGAERLMFSNNNLEECLWAIYMILDGKENLEGS